MRQLVWTKALHVLLVAFAAGLSASVTAARPVTLSALPPPSRPAASPVGEPLSWRIETVDSVSSCFDSGASLALDRGRVPHISYLEAGAFALKYAYRAAEGWVTTVVDDSEAVGKHSSIALDSLGRPHISYRDATDNALKVARWDGTRWITEFVGGTGEAGWYSSLALDSDDHPHIAYMSGAVKYAHWTGSRWEIQVVDAQYPSPGMSLALDSRGRPHISYAAGSPESLRYASYDGSRWITETVDVGVVGGSALVGAYSSLALDSGNNPHISYARYGVTIGGDWPNDLRYARKQAGSWQITSPDTQGAVGYYSSIALDERGHPHISYWDYDNKALKYVYWNGVRWMVLPVDSADLWGYTSLKLDQNGQPHIAYCDGGRVKYASSPSTAASIPPAGGSLISSFDQTTYTFAPGTFTDTVTLTHIPHLSGEAPSRGHLASIGHVFEVVGVYDSTGQPAEPTRPYTLTVGYTVGEKGPAIESSLGLYYWDATQWVREPTSVVDTEANMVTATPDHFGLWAVLGETRRLFLPLVSGHS